jgi:hypothetical protein
MKSPAIEQDLFRSLISLGFKHLHTDGVPNQNEVARWLRVEHDIDIELERLKVDRNPPIYAGFVESNHEGSHFNVHLEYDEMQLKCVVEGIRFVKNDKEYRKREIEINRERVD